MCTAAAGRALLFFRRFRSRFIKEHITAFTDAGIKYISKEMTSDLKDGNYFSAFQTFSELCDEFITQARNGKPYDRKSLPKEPLSPIWILISLGVGVVLSLVIVGRMKAQLKTVRFQAAAGSYVKDDSLDITESRDSVTTG